MSVSSENIAGLIADACGITRGTEQNKDYRLSKPEMLSVYAFIMHLKKNNKDMEDACKLVSLEPELIETLKRLNMIGKG